MIRILFSILALFTLAACKDAEPTSSRETSPGGIAYTLLHMPAHEDVSIHIAWPTDWGYRPETNKAAPLVGTQLILAGGAEGFPAGVVGERLADLNSEGDVYAAFEDNVIGELTFERRHMDETITIANAHLRAPTLDQMWFGRIRDEIGQNMAETRSQPAHAGFDALRWAVFGNQPLRAALSLDEPDTFDALTRADVVDWHAETFTRNPEAIVVAGAIEAKDAGAAVDALLDGLPETGPPISRKSTPDFSARRVLLHVPEAQVTTLTLVARLPPTRAVGELEDLVLVHALGGDDQSVLFDAVRTGLRASYGFGAGVANYTRDNRILFLTGEIETARLAEVERVVREAYGAFRDAGPSGDLAARTAPLKAHFEGVPDYLVDQARSELQGALDGHDTGRSLRLVDELGAVTEDSLRDRLADDFPAPDDFIVIAVSPDAQALPGACVIRTPADAVECR